MFTIHSLNAIQTLAKLDSLVRLLIDCVDAGASVGFLPPLERTVAKAYWQEASQAVAAGSRILLVAQEDARLIGTVQLDLCMRGNGLHRAEVSKLLVDTSCRRRGVGRRLMEALEAEAQTMGRTLLFLDTRAGDPSERLYQKLGYIMAGTIPYYAQSADGTLHTTVFYYRLLG